MSSNLDKTGFDLDALERLRADWPNGNGSRNRLIGALLIGGQLDALIAEVKRLREIISTPELGIRKLLVEGGTIQGDFTAPPYVVLLMGEALLGMLADAPNYQEAKIVAGALDGQKYVLRVERYFSKTPHEKRVEAEAELERVRGVATEGLREIAGRQIEELGNLPHAILAALGAP